MNENELSKPATVDEKRNREQVQQTDGPAKPPETTARRAKRPPFYSFAELIQTTYETRVGVKTLQKADTKALLSAPPMKGSERDKLLELARSDKTLEKSKQLVLLSLRSEAPRISHYLRDFARDAIGCHELFRQQRTADLLTNLHGTSIDAVAAIFMTSNVKLLTERTENPLPKRQAEQCVRNAVHCVLLLLWVAQGGSVERILRFLQRHSWSKKAKRYRSEKQQLEALVISRDPTAASVTFTLLERRALELEQQAEAAARSQERVRTRSQRLEQQLTAVEDKLHQTTGECERLRQELRESIDTLATKEAHWRHEYETLKGRALRRLNEESSLLEEGLHALRREPPKVSVMIDHAERAIDGLKRVAERIRNESLS